MQRKLSLAVVGVLGFALTLTACGDDSNDSGDDGGDGSSERPSAGKIGVILPDTESSVRWETADRPELEAAFEAAGVEYDIQNAEGDAEKMTTIADGMIADGVTVLAIVNLDSESGAAIQEKAAVQGVKTIDYDRLTLGGSADYYVSFDNAVVGELQGQGLADCLGDKPANIVYLNGSPTDNNATLFSAGAHSVLDPITNYTVVGEQAVPDWDNEQAVTIFEQLYTQAGGKVDGVLAANDGLGGCGHLGPREERPGRQGPRDRSGRHRRGSAERPRRHPVHDGLQVRQARGRSARRRGDRPGQRRGGRDHRHDRGQRGRPRRSVDPARAGRRSPRTTSRTSSTTVASRQPTCAPASTPHLCTEAGIS